MNRYVICVFDVCGIMKVYFQGYDGDNWKWTHYPERAKIYYDEEEADTDGYVLTNKDFLSCRGLDYSVKELSKCQRGYGAPRDVEPIFD